jgi:sensor histidine kinase YesM
MKTSAWNSISHRIALVSIVGLLTLVVFAWALRVRQISEYPPLSPASLIDFDFDTYEIGVILQELLIPVALIYLLSGTGPFRRIVGGKAAPRDALKLFGALTVVQVLSLSYILVTDELATFGVLVVVVGGLLGGWRMGLGLGLITMLALGTQECVLYSEEEELLLIYQMEGWRGLFDPALLSDTFFWYYIADLGASSVVWAGLVSGLFASLLEERRFTPLATLGLGVGISLGIGYSTAISWQDPAILAVYVVPSALISGLAMVAVALIVRGVQAGAAQRKAETAELARIQAELLALRAQINPHFLFNAINTIRYFVRTDPETARRLLLDLSEVFQRALRSGEFVPLRDELDYVGAYLALEKARLDERLQIEQAIEAEALLDHPVPTLILQPIVENAVAHGIAKKSKGGTVRVSVEQLGGDLMLRVEDDGPGIPPARLVEVLGQDRGSGMSIGLRNVDGRLRTLYGEDYRLIVESEPDRGTRVKIKIPIRR